VRRLTAALGSEQRAWGVVLLAGALALSDADLATVGAVASELERNLHISDVQVGLLATATALTGAVATLPIGALTDRVPRVRLLMISVLLWAAAMVAAALSASYPMLLVSRVALGAVTATSGPTVASLTGDLFPAAVRAKVYGWIIAGELLGGAVGLVAGGALAGITSWRAAFGVLALPALVLARGLHRRLDEPARRAPEGESPAGVSDADGDRPRVPAAEPDRTRVLDRDPSAMSLWSAVRYVISIPTNRSLIGASALGYFFFGGVQTFAIVLLRHRFGVGQTAASGLIGLVAISSVAGVLMGGRWVDRRMAAGHVATRVGFPTAAYLVAVIAFAPALLLPALVVAMPLFCLGAAAVSATNPALDAARLDVLPGGLWGRGEAVRTVLRQLSTAGAPISFGLVSELLGSGGHGAALGGAHRVHSDLHDTFLVMLSVLVLAAVVLGRARKGYPRDVATAAAGEAAIRDGSAHSAREGG
jgi:predicted MFS family arabinose efflux permease